MKLFGEGLVRTRDVRTALITAVCTLAVPASSALADAGPAPASTGTPLAPRPTHVEKPLPAPNFAGLAAKMGFALVVVGGGLYLYRRRMGKPMAVAPTLSIVARTSLSLRNELVVVEVDGQRLLLGVTPTSITRLTVLSETTASDDMDLAESTSEPPESAVTLAELMETRLQGRGNAMSRTSAPAKALPREVPPEPREEPAAEEPSPPPRESVGEGGYGLKPQARGTRASSRASAKALPARGAVPKEAPLERQVQGLSRARRGGTEGPLLLGDDTGPNAGARKSR